MSIAIIVPPAGIDGRGSILAAMQSAAIRLIGRKPSAFFTASGVFENEIADLINEVAQDIAKYQDWQALTKIASVVGDGSSKVVDLPRDYDRQTLISDIQRPANWLWGYSRLTDINDFMFDQSQGTTAGPGSWIIYGNQLQFTVAPAGEAKFPYITSHYAASSEGLEGDRFTADTDIFMLPERLLTLGLVWRWRENKKLDASGDQEAFIKALDEYAGKDKGSAVIRFNGMRRRLNTAIPYSGTAR